MYSDNMSEAKSDRLVIPLERKKKILKVFYFFTNLNVRKKPLLISLNLLGEKKKQTAVETSRVEQVISNSSDSNNDDIDHVREARGRPKLSEEERKKRRRMTV